MPKLFSIVNVQVEPHPYETAIIINYNIVGQLENSPATARPTSTGQQPAVAVSAAKQLSRIVQIKNLTRRTDPRKLAEEIVNSCATLLVGDDRPTVLPDLVQALKIIRERTPPRRTTEESLNGADRRLSTRHGASTTLSPHSQAAHQQQLLLSPQQQQQQAATAKEKLPPASMKNLSAYLDQMYDEIPQKIDGAAHILALARKQSNLEPLISSDRFMSALSRVLREDHSRSLELSNMLISIFLCFAKFQHFHPLLQSVRIGSLTMEIMHDELERYEKWKAEMTHRQNQQQQRGGAAGGNLEALRQNFRLLRRRQDALLISCLQTLSFLGYEELLVQQKMIKKQLVDLLRRCLQRGSIELQRKCLKFLHIISMFKDNHEILLRSNIMKICLKILLQTTSAGRSDKHNAPSPNNSSLGSSNGRSSSASAFSGGGGGGGTTANCSNDDLQLTLLRLLHNLSFSYEFRRQLMLRNNSEEIINTFVAILTTARHHSLTAAKRAASLVDAEVRQRVVLQLLYQLSMEEKVRTQLFLTHHAVLAILFKNLTNYVRKSNSDDIVTVGILINLTVAAQAVETIETAFMGDELPHFLVDDDDDSTKKPKPAAANLNKNMFLALLETALLRDDWRVLKLLNIMARKKSPTCQKIFLQHCDKLAQKVTSAFRQRQTPPKFDNASRAKTATGGKKSPAPTTAFDGTALGSPDMLSQCIESLALIDFSPSKQLDQFCTEHNLIAFLAEITTTAELNKQLPDTILSAIHLTASLARDATCAVAILSTQVFANILNVTLLDDRNTSGGVNAGGGAEANVLLSSSSVVPTAEIMTEIIYVAIQLARHLACRAQLVHNRMLLALLSLHTTSANATEEVVAELSLADTLIQLLAADDDSIRERIKEEKFSSYNEGWLEAIQNRLFGSNAAGEQLSFSPGDGGYVDYGGDDAVESLLFQPSSTTPPYGLGKSSVEGSLKVKKLPLDSADDDEDEDMIDDLVGSADENNMFFKPDDWEESFSSSQPDTVNEDEENDDYEEAEMIAIGERRSPALRVQRKVNGHLTPNKNLDEILTQQTSSSVIQQQQPKRPSSRMEMRTQRPPSARPQFV